MTGTLVGRQEEAQRTMREQRTGIHDATSPIVTTRRETVRRFGGSLALAALATVGLNRKLLAGEHDQHAWPMEGLYVVMRTWTLKPEASAQELADLVSAGFVPIISAGPGFVAYFDVWNETTRQWTAISIFESKEGADESTAQAAEWAAAKVADFLASGPEVSDGEIVVFAGELAGERIEGAASSST